jgi:hypothetical protein
VIPLLPKRRHPGRQSRVAAKSKELDTTMAKTTRRPSTRQPGESLSEWLSRLCRRYGRSRSPSLRHEARQWRRVLRAYRCRTVSA